MAEDMASSEKRVAGTKQVLRAIENGTAKAVYLAQDCDDFLYRRIMNAAGEKNVPVQKVETMKELGKMCLVEVKTTAAALLK
jgi:Ribosomal protein HS6-type (S12/L30/L7a)